jgi:hypothetical protein
MQESSGAGRRLKIALFSQPEYFRFIYEDELSAVADVFELRMQMGLSASDFQPLIDFGADYNFFFRGEFVPAGVLEQLKGVRVALSSEPFPRLVDGRPSYTADSVLRYLAFRGIRSMPFDYVFHYDAASLPFLRWDRLSLSGQFPLPVATSTYKPVDTAPRWDIFFIGRSTGHRESFFGMLKHRYNFLHICHGVWGPPLVEYLTAARICLNVHAEDEVSWEPRMQMMLACGVFVISERLTPNPYLRPGIDYVEATSPAQMEEAVAYYLAHPQEREQIARSGCERVRELLASRPAFEQLIAGIRDGRYPRFSTGPGNMPLNALASLNERWWRARRKMRSMLRAA